MFKEKMPAMYEPEERRGLAPQEKILMIKQELDRIAEEYTKKKPEELTADDYFTALNKIETLRKMAENSKDDKLPAYLDSKLVEIKKYKDITSKSRLENIDKSIKIPRDPKRPSIGTHGRF